MANGIIFAKGHLIAEGAGPAGGDVEFGELQDCSFEVRDTTKEARGPDSVYPLAREIAERSLTFRASWLRIKAQGLVLLTGGTASYASDETTIAVGKTSLPSTFKAVLKSPTDGSDIHQRVIVVMAIVVSDGWIVGTVKVDRGIGPDC